MYETILVPTDGSDISINAAAEAIDLADDSGTVHVLAVVEKLPMYTQSGKGAKLAEKDDTEVREYLSGVTERVEEMATESGLGCTTAVTEGVPYREILSTAEDVSADAIVMGKRGQGAAAGDILGSTTERVAERASSTVVIVPES